MAKLIEILHKDMVVNILEDIIIEDIVAKEDIAIEGTLEVDKLIIKDMLN